MTSFVIVLEILFLILVANSIEPLHLPARRAFSSSSSDDFNKHVVSKRSPEREAKRFLFEHDQDASGTDREVGQPLREGPQRPRPASRSRSERDSQDLALVASPSGLSTTTSLPHNERPADGSDEQRPAHDDVRPPELSAAELCYLANGGSSMTLTVNEATPVGSVIGTIDVNGEPKLEGGNVDLIALDPPASGQQPGGGSPVEPFAALQTGGASSRQNRRLVGRRDTSSRPETSSPAEAVSASSPTLSPAASSSFYALVTGGPASQSSGNQQAAAVRVEPGTKNLILARALDKESAEGEFSQLVNVRCRPRQPSGARKQSSYTTIPIRLIITDANDHAPEFVGQLPYVINISETTPAGSVVSRDILALDKDSAGPHSTIHYRVLDSDAEQAAGAQLAAHFAFANPLEPHLSLTSPLDFESLPASSFALSIAAQDQGEPEALQSIAQVQVNVLDFDDQNPKFLDEKYTLVMDDTQSSLVGQTLRVSPRNLRAEDGDRGINAPVVYSFDATSGQPAADASDGGGAGAPGEEPASSIEQFLHLNPTSGELRLIRQWPMGGASLPLTLVVRATQADNRDRYALTTLTIVRSPSQPSSRGGPAAQAGEQARKRGIEFLEERLVVQVPEDTPVNEKIARVRAQHLQDGPFKSLAVTSQQIDIEPPSTSRRGRQQADQMAGLEQARQTSARDTTAVVAQHMWLVASSAGQPEQQQQQQQLRSRPINYQILDDQTDQFGINGLGEILLKRPLDYEQRQEFRIRVLATYTKYSDICHVQIAVLNVNDNKPKFTQAQYSFHLTEARLRSNVIGAVQAQDADLNDTVHYSLVSAAGEHHARLFDIAPSAGQLSLRPGVRQLNASHYQLTVQADDSLGPGAARHRQQARVNVYVAPQVVGRALGALVQAESEPGHEHEARLFNSQYSLQSSESGATGWPARKSSRDYAQRFLKEAGRHANSEHHLAAAESSTVSTTNRRPPSEPEVFITSQEQPAPSNQRSSMATVVASLQHMMKSVNFVEMPVSSALLLSVLLTFLVCLLLVVVVSMSVHVYRRTSKARRGRHQQRRLTAAARLRHAQLSATDPSASSAGSSSSPYGSSTSSSPLSTGAVPKQHGRGEPSTARAYFDNLALAAATKAPSKSEPSGAHEPASSPPTSSSGLAEASRVSSASSPSLLLASKQKQSAAVGAAAKKKRRKKPAEGKHFEALKISISQEATSVIAQSARAAANETYLRAMGPSKQNPLYLETSAPTTSASGKQSQAAESSQLTLDSNATCLSCTDDDDDNSSAINCGHYSVNGTINNRAPARARNKCEPLESAISKIVKQHRDQELATPNSSAKMTARKSPAPADLYRRLPLMNSLVRPARSVASNFGPASSRVAPIEQLLSSHQQRAEQAEQVAGQRREGVAADGAGADQQIKWPSDAIPQRIKKLTWDDELSCCGDNESISPHPNAGSQFKTSTLARRDNDQDCYISPDIRFGSAPGEQHRYDTKAESAAHDQFLFSLNNHMLPSLNQQQHQQPSSQFGLLDDDPNEALASSCRNQNNCLDYTIVNNSQFHVDSLACLSGGGARSEPAGRASQRGDYYARLSEKGDHAERAEHSQTSSSGQTNVTFKLNQNYQDLRLMTTAIL